MIISSTPVTLLGPGRRRPYSRPPGRDRITTAQDPNRCDRIAPCPSAAPTSDASGVQSIERFANAHERVAQLAAAVERRREEAGVGQSLDVGVCRIAPRLVAGVLDRRFIDLDRRQQGRWRRIERCQPLAVDELAPVSYTHLTLPTSDLV